MPIIQHKDIYDDSKSPFENLKKDLVNLQKEVNKLTKANKSLSNILQTVKKTNDGDEAKQLVNTTNALTKSTLKLKEVKTAAIRVEEQLMRENTRLSNSQTKEAQELAKLKIRNQEQNKLLKQQAKEALGLSGAYDKLAKKTRDAQKRYKDLAAEFGENSKQARKAKVEFQKLDDKLSKVNKSARDGKKDVGRYAEGFKGLGSKITAAFGVVGVAIAAVVGAFKALGDIMGATAEGQMLMAEAGGAASSVYTQLRDDLGDVLSDIIDWFKDLLDDPMQALKDIGQAIYDNIINRFYGILDIGKALYTMLSGDIKKGLEDLKEASVKAATGVEGLTEKTDEYIQKLKEQAEFGAKIARQEKELELNRSKYSIREAKDLREIADLRAKAADKDNYTAIERQKFLEKALDLQRKIGKTNIEYANKELQLAQEVFDRNKSNIDDEIELNKLKKKADEVAASNLKKEKLLISELQSIKIQAAKEEEELQKRLQEQKELNLAKNIEGIKSENALKIEQLNNITELEKNLSDARLARIKEENARRLEEERVFRESWLAVVEQAEQSAAQLAKDIYNNYSQEKIAKLQSDAEAEKEILKQKLEAGEISEKQYRDKIANLDKETRISVAKEEKKQAIYAVGIDTLVAVIKTFAKYGFTPAGWVAAASMTALGAIQAAAIAAKPIPKFAKGEVNIEGKSHSQGGILAEIEGGESVINKSATSNSENLLTAINNGLITDKDYINLSGQDANLLIAGLLMSNNKTSKQMLDAILNSVSSYDRGDTRYIIHANGTIEKFKI